MGVFSKEMTTMNDLFIQGLGSMYYAEQQILKSLLEMIETATNRELKQGLTKHRDETENHLARLEQVFKLHGS